MNPYTISPIVDGQYYVSINLDEWMHNESILEFYKCYNELCKEDNNFKKVCSVDGHILQYRSETLFPTSDKIDHQKKKVMIILGNPATHSVANGMFFYSKVNDDELVKSRILPQFVIPVKLVLDLIGERESSFFIHIHTTWIPAYAGMGAPGSRRDLGGESPPPRLCPISVAEGNCVAERRGGEQPEANKQSVG